MLFLFELFYFFQKLLKSVFFKYFEKIYIFLIHISFCISPWTPVVNVIVCELPAFDV